MTSHDIQSQISRLEQEKQNILALREANKIKTIERPESCSNVFIGYRDQAAARYIAEPIYQYQCLQEISRLDYDPVYDSQLAAIDQQINDLKIQLESSTKKETSIISENTLNQLGEITAKPETRGLLLIGGLVVAAMALSN